MILGFFEIGFWVILGLFLCIFGVALFERQKNINLSRLNQRLMEESTGLKIENAAISSSFDSSVDMETRFESIALKIFETSQTKFESRSAKTVGDVLKPFEKDIKEFKDRIEGFNRDNRDSYIDLNRQLRALREVNLTLNEQALDLTNALKGDSKIRGDWGEERLDRLLEESGFKEGRDYYKQFSYVDGEGDMKRPDCVVRLPRGRNVVIDSKVSLVDYAKYQSTENGVDKERSLKAHITSLRAHIKGLSGKSYGDLTSSLDQVLMFVPIEPALMLALDKESGLEREALSSDVVLTSSSTLLWALKIISFLWTQEKQAKNVLEIASAGGKVHDQAALVAESVESIGVHIERAQESFDKTKSRLVSGRGSLISQITKLRELGAKTKRQIPEQYRDNELDLKPDADS